eukprot:3245580-Prorocentrum_lima.AAC.1
MTLEEHIAHASPTARPIVGVTRPAGVQWVLAYMENIRQRFIREYGLLSPQEALKKYRVNRSLFNHRRQWLESL